MRKQTVLKVRNVARDVAMLADRVFDLFKEPDVKWDDIGGVKETSALRRRSMDLTRLLAELRQNK